MAVGNDWRDSALYAPLCRADRSIFAWEWLRRDKEYRAAACCTDELLPAARDRWGLHFKENPELGAPFARPMWTASADPFVLPVAAIAAEPGPDTFDPADFPGLVSWIDGTDGTQHLLISDGLQTIRLDLVEGRIGPGGSKLRYLPAGIRSAERPLLALRRFLALCKRRELAGPLFGAETRARRWIVELRVHDALQAGASQRDIASSLFDANCDLARWRVEAPTVRLQVQRLVRRARLMACGGYRALLDPASSQ